VLADGAVVGRIFKSNAGACRNAWLWTLAFGHHEDRSPTHGLRGDPRGRDGGVRHTGKGSAIEGAHAPDLQSLADTLAGLLWLIEVTRSRLARGRNSEVRLHSDKGGDIQ
jgi:hypothetical protein